MLLLCNSFGFVSPFSKNFRTKSHLRALHLLNADTGKATIMKIRLRAALTSNVSPFFFALTCLLLVSVMFSAKIMADQVSTTEDSGLYRFAIVNRYFWLEPD